MKRFNLLSSQLMAFKKCFQDEAGLSLVEVVASVVLMAILLPSAAYLFIFSQSVIQNNRLRSEAIQVAEDLKQNFEYRSQTQDWADLNRIALIKSYGKSDDEALKSRKSHLILDNTGVEMTQKNQPLFDEILIDETDNQRGDFIRKVTYDQSVFDLPEKLNTLENQKYMGRYLRFNEKKRDYELTDFLVRVDVLALDERIEESVDLEIGVWDSKTGNQLHSIVYKWVVKF